MKILGGGLNSVSAFCHCSGVWKCLSWHVCMIGSLQNLLRGQRCIISGATDYSSPSVPLFFLSFSLLSCSSPFSPIPRCLWKSPLEAGIQEYYRRTFFWKFNMRFRAFWRQICCCQISTFVNNFCRHWRVRTGCCLPEYATACGVVDFFSDFQACQLFSSFYSFSVCHSSFLQRTSFHILWRRKIFKHTGVWCHTFHVSSASDSDVCCDTFSLKTMPNKNTSK